MEELDPAPQEKIEDTDLDPRRQEKFINEMKINKSLKLWEYNIDTGELDEVSIEKFISLQAKTGKLEAVRKGNASWNERSMYFQALNEKNAIRKFEDKLPSFRYTPVVVLKLPLNYCLHIMPG